MLEIEKTENTETSNGLGGICRERERAKISGLKIKYSVSFGHSVAQDAQNKYECLPPQWPIVAYYPLF